MKCQQMLMGVRTMAEPGNLALFVEVPYVDLVLFDNAAVGRLHRCVEIDEHHNHGSILEEHLRIKARNFHRLESFEKSRDRYPAASGLQPWNVGRIHAILPLNIFG